jgi:hypothetical protein
MDTGNTQSISVINCNMSLLPPVRTIQVQTMVKNAKYILNI